jgi:GntR family transcriptional regulator/MocR family aminotransferase
LHRNSGKTLQAQLRELLRAAIAGLGPGTRLPSTRALAQRLRVSRNTVLYVYEELALEGLITTRTGSGTRVSRSEVKRGPSFPANIDMRRILRDAQYPSSARQFRDPDGNAIYLHA